jgi:hypothetical protein
MLRASIVIAIGKMAIPSLPIGLVRLERIKSIARIDEIIDAILKKPKSRLLFWNEITAIYVKCRATAPHPGSND